MCNAYANAEPFGNMFTWLAYAAGAVCTMQGVHHFRLHSESPQNHKIMTPIMLWVGAGCLLALPNVFSAVVSSLYTAVDGGGLDGCSVGNTGNGGTSLDTMVAGFVSNIKFPIIYFTSLIAILCGTFMMVRGLMKASKYGFDPKTNSVTSILANIIFGALLMTIGQNLDYMVGSIFGVRTSMDQITQGTVLSWAFVSDLGGGSAQFATAVAAALGFVQLIGVIAFVRGWLVMKKVVEGGGNVTLAQGITHILGGVLAINIASFIKIMDSTFGTGLI